MERQGSVVPFLECIHRHGRASDVADLRLEGPQRDGIDSGAGKNAKALVNPGEELMDEAFRESPGLVEARLMTVKSYVKFGFILSALAGFVFVSRRLPLAEWIEVFPQWVSGLGLIGMVLFGLAYAAATVLMLPGSILTLSAGAVFGLIPGFLTVSLGSPLGASLAFLVSRFVARKRVESWIQEKPSFSVIDKAVAKQGWKIVFLTRLSPVFPFNFQNYAYGLTSVSFWHYVLASWVGMLPGTFLYVYFGTLGRSGLEAASGASNTETLEIALQVVGLLATLAVTILITRTAKRALREAGV